MQRPRKPGERLLRPQFSSFRAHSPVALNTRSTVRVSITPIGAHHATLQFVNVLIIQMPMNR